MQDSDENFIYKDILKDINKDIKYKGKRIEVTLSASRELTKHGKNLQFVIKILEEGYGCSASKRKKEIVEKCLHQGNKEYKAVLALDEFVFPDNHKETKWKLIHFGKKTWKRRK